MKDLLIIIGIFAIWITLNRWVLPWFGISTCMSGGCCPTSCSTSLSDPKSPNNDPISEPPNEGK